MTFKDRISTIILKYGVAYQNEQATEEILCAIRAENAIGVLPRMTPS